MSSALAERPAMRISDIEKEPGTRVFVMNTSNVNGMKGVINIPHVFEGGASITIIVPLTWIPVEITEQVPKDQILQNPYFLRMVRRGYLTLIPTKEAVAILEREDARAERDRIDLDVQRVGNEVNNPHVVSSTGQGAVQPSATPGMPGNSAPTTAAPTNVPSMPPASAGMLNIAPDEVGVKPQLMDVMNRDDISDPNRYNIVKTMIDELTASDLQFVVKRSTSENLTRLVTDKLRSLK